MLKNIDIIVFALPRWDGKYTSTSYNIAWELAKDNRVLFVDNPFTCTDVIFGLKNKQIQRRLKYFVPFRSGLGHLIKNEIRMELLTTMPVLPINFLPKGKLYNFFSYINTAIVKLRLQKAIRKLKFRNPVFINSFNFYYPDIGIKIKKSLHVYHCVDAMIRPYTMRHGPYLEKKLIKNADLTIVTSEQLRKEKSVFSDEVYCILNAANFELSSKALKEETEIPNDLLKIKNPRIGYFGNIERRLDYELLLSVIQKKRQWSFVFVGPHEQEFIPARLFEQKNVFFMGPKPYESMPSYLKGFDIALIPFKPDSVSRTIFPLKIFEYLGAGVPVLMSDFNPDLSKLTKHSAQIYSSESEFISKAEMLLKNNNTQQIQNGIKLARQHTWEKRGQQFSELLAEKLNQKNQD